MKIAKSRWGVSLMLCGIMPGILYGCGSKQSEPPVTTSKAPPAALSADEQKFVATAISLSPQQQGEFFRKNPKMAQNSQVMAKIRAEMPKVAVRQTRGEKPRLPTGRPSLPTR